MNDWLELFEWRGRRLAWGEDELSNGKDRVPVVNGIPRFIPDESYSKGNFAMLRQKHSTLQLDSVNGTRDRLNTLLERTHWPKDFFRNKLVLECGCGAGPDTEVLLGLGARVLAADIAGVDVAKRNLGEEVKNRYFLIQADIMNLPLIPRKFDIVFCHRVLQHTPDPEKTLDHILQFVKPDGAVFVHSYARTMAQMFRWKYCMRPVTKRMDGEKLYRLISWYAPSAFKLTNAISKVPGGNHFNHVFIPFLNKRHLSKFAAMSDEEIIEYSVHDTFDALAPRYDHPVGARTMEAIARRHLNKPFEIERRHTVTLLRTVM